tara:strand:- start:390 stop:641 length:252 start_codon:yes stop_codon:yes gene_type:complete
MDNRRKKLLFRTEHCGMKENDLLLGRFARANVKTLSDKDIEAFEALLKESDNDIYNWITMREPAPKNHTTPLMAALIAFNSKE